MPNNEEEVEVVVSGSVKEVREAVKAHADDLAFLIALWKAEIAGKGRKSALKSIDRAFKAMGQQLDAAADRRAAHKPAPKDLPRRLPEHDTTHPPLIRRSPKHGGIRQGETLVEARARLDACLAAERRSAAEVKVAELEAEAEAAKGTPAALEIADRLRKASADLPAIRAADQRRRAKAAQAEAAYRKRVGLPPHPTGFKRVSPKPGCATLEVV